MDAPSVECRLRVKQNPSDYTWQHEPIGASTHDNESLRRAEILDVLQLFRRDPSSICTRETTQDRSCIVEDRRIHDAKY